MHYSGAHRRLVSSVCRTKSPWESALAYYQLSLVEVGSLLELEHAQRIALLFLKKHGEPGQLSSWARLFYFEEVPISALMLKALVRHDLWRSAINLWAWNPNNALGEALVDELMSKNLWEQSLFVVHQLLGSDSSGIDFSKTKVKILRDEQNLGSDVALALNDAFRLATDPTFIPEEERYTKSTLPNLINTVFPLKSQWQEATSLLVRLSQRCASCETQKGLLELSAARSAYHGGRFEDIFNWINQTRSIRYSRSLQKIFFSSAVALQRFEDALLMLEGLSKEELDDIPSQSLQDLCTKFMYEYNQGKHVELLDRFSVLALKCSSQICCKQTINKLRCFLKHNAVNTNSLDKLDVLEDTKELAVFFPGSFFSRHGAPSVTEIDETANILLSRGRWKDSLKLLSILVETKPVNAKERVIFEAAKASLANWETAILFIA